MLYINLTILFLLTYLIGAIPFGFVLTKIFLKKDVRDLGSKSTGATNVLRTGSKSIALLTLICDAGKVWVAYILFKYMATILFGNIATAGIFSLYAIYIKMIVAGIVVIAHCYPVYLGFKGGKGVATVFGSLFLFSWELPLIAFSTWLIIAFSFKKSSLAAILTAIALPFYAYFISEGRISTREHLAIFYIGVVLFVIFRHTKNIIRLIKGQEDSIKLKK